MRILITILLTLTTTVMLAQTDVDRLKQEVDTLFKQKRPLEALSIMEDLVSQKDTIEGYARYKTRIGLIYQSLDSIEQARKWYLSVMGDPLITDSVEDYWLGEWEVKGNYKHVSCYQMAVSYYEEGDYDNAIKYYKLALDTYPYFHFSGSDINKNRVRICNNIADLYSKKGNLTTAFSYLLPFFNNYIVYSDRARNKAARIIKEHNLQEHLLTLMNKDYNALIDNEIIALTLGEQKIVLKDLSGQNKTKTEIEEEAKYYWSLISMSDMMDEFNEDEKEKK